MRLIAWPIWYTINPLFNFLFLFSGISSSWSALWQVFSKSLVTIIYSGCWSKQRRDKVNWVDWWYTITSPMRRVLFPILWLGKGCCIRVLSYIRMLCYLIRLQRISSELYTSSRAPNLSWTGLACRFLLIGKLYAMNRVPLWLFLCLACRVLV